MYTMLVFAALGILTSLWLYRTYSRGKASDVVAWLLVSIFWGCVSGVLGLAVTAGIDSQCATELRPFEHISLVSLRNGDAISGSFFLGSGTLEGREYYFFFKKTGSGFQFQKLDAESGVVIYEEDRQDGELVVSRPEYVNPRAKYWAMPSELREQYAFHIPRGSVKREFNLN